MGDFSASAQVFWTFLVYGCYILTRTLGLERLLEVYNKPWFRDRVNEQVGFPIGPVVKNPPANARDMGSIPGSGRSPGEGKGNPLQYSCLGNPTDRGAWQATVRGVQRVGPT